VSITNHSRPGVGMIICGAFVICLSAARVSSGWNPCPGWLWYEMGSCVFGLTLGMWGWLRLRQAKEAQPDLSWWQFLHVDLVGLGIFVVLMAVLSAMPTTWREEIWKSLKELMELFNAARGRP
jgi:hypothetical protein